MEASDTLRAIKLDNLKKIGQYEHKNTDLLDDTRQINCAFQTSTIINAPKNHFLPVVKNVFCSLSDVLAGSTFSHCHYVLYDYMMSISYSCRKISPPNIRKGNTLFLRKEKKKQSICSSSKLHNLFEFAFLQHSHAYAQIHTQAGGILQIPKRGIIIIVKGNAPCRNLH